MSNNVLKFIIILTSCLFMSLGVIANDNGDVLSQEDNNTSQYKVKIEFSDQDPVILKIDNESVIELQGDKCEFKTKDGSKVLDLESANKISYIVEANLGAGYVSKDLPEIYFGDKGVVVLYKGSHRVKLTDLKGVCVKNIQFNDEISISTLVLKGVYVLDIDQKIMSKFIIK